MLLQALLVALDEPTRLGLSTGTIPVFLPLRELGDDQIELGDFIQAQLPGRGRKFAADFGRRLVERGELLLLLDGLDEIAALDQRERVARWIEDQLGDMDNSHVLVSCRYAGYLREVELDADFVELNLRSLDDKQMRELVRNWFALVEHNDLLPPGQTGAARAEALLEVLEGPQFSGAQMYGMTRNPLLLTGICWVHYDRGELAQARGELFEQCIEVLGKKWRERSKAEGARPFPLASERELEPLLRPLAAWMHDERGRRRAHERELRDPIARSLEGHELDSVDALEFLRGVRDDAGLLSGVGEDHYEFVHLGFQEFLTARQRCDERAFEALAARFGDSWWREVVLLSLGQAGSFEPFMRALAQREEFPQWSESELMQLCLTEAASASAAPFLEVVRGPECEAQLAAAKLAARMMPRALDELDGLLGQHRQPAVREWWARHRGAGQERISIRGVDLVRVPAGRFWMGSPEGTGGRSEQPRHEVELAAFYMARAPVTNAQYARYLEAKPGIVKPQYWGDARFNQPPQPVVGVSWRDAQAYCEWAGLVLPTEAQWEYACRAGTQTVYWSGDELADLDRVGWYAGNSDKRLHPVAEKEANAFGLHDVHGNVWEWCRDDFGDYVNRPRASDGARHEPSGDANRVRRGGSWSYDANVARAAHRHAGVPSYRGYGIGFRPGRSPE